MRGRYAKPKRLSGRQIDRRNAFAAENMGLVHHMARVMRKKWPKLPRSEIFSECQMALLRAATNFKPSLGFKFSTYACVAMSRAVNRIGRGRLPDGRFKVPAQLDAEAEVALPTSETEVEMGCLAELSGIVARLDPISRQVIRLRFFKGRTLEYVGERMGFTKERARQVQNKALAALRVAVQEALN